MASGHMFSASNPYGKAAKPGEQAPVLSHVTFGLCLHGRGCCGCGCDDKELLSASRLTAHGSRLTAHGSRLTPKEASSFKRHSDARTLSAVQGMARRTRKKSLDWCKAVLQTVK